MASQVVAGINKNVMSIAKHYIVNNQETHRSGVNEVVDERTLMELYGPPFRAAVQHASGVMCAYVARAMPARTRCLSMLVMFFGGIHCNIPCLPSLYKV